MDLTFDSPTAPTTINDDGFEYGIIKDGDDPGYLHRGPMTKADATDWVAEWDEDMADRPAAQGMFRVVRRPVGAWEIV